MRNRYIRLGVLAALSSAVTPCAWSGDIAFDGSLPGTRAGALSSLNDTYLISQSRGFLNGSNLFHSFDVFNLNKGETAQFTGNAAITNIISRVTGGIPTTIDGTIRSSIDGANFWFVNPAGLTVGPNGTLDVSGAVALGAADAVDFATGARFPAVPDGKSLPVSLLMANPVDFGFLNNTAAGELVILNGEFRRPAPNHVADSRQIQPLASNPKLEKFSLLLSGGAGVFVESAGDLVLDDARIRTGVGQFTGPIDLTALGSIDIRNSDLLTTMGTGGAGGDIFIEGGELVTLSRSSLVAESRGTNVSTGTVSVIGSGVLVNDQTLVATQFSGSGVGADPIGASNVTITTTGFSDEAAPQAQLNVATEGVIRIVDSAVLSTNVGGRLASNSNAITIGNVGSMGLGATHVVIAGSVIASDASAGGSGGLVRIASDNDTRIMASASGGYSAGGARSDAGSLITALASDTAARSGGLSVFAGGDLTIQDTLLDFSSAAAGSTQFPSGLGAELVGTDIELTNTTLRTDSSNGASAGNIDFDALNAIRIRGSTLTTSTTVRDPSAPAAPMHRAGDISFIAASLTGEAVEGITITGSTLRTNSSNTGSPTLNPLGAAAGSILLDAAESAVTISASTLESASLGANSGEAGSVTLAGFNVDIADTTINVASETLNPQLALTSNTDTRSISLGASDTFKLTNSFLSATTSGVSAAGDVFLTFNNIDIRGSTLQASTTGAGAAGSVSLLGRVDLLAGLDPTEVVPGLTSVPFVRITDSTLATSTGDTPSLAGNIDIFSASPIELTRATLNVSATSRTDLGLGSLSSDGFAGIFIEAEINPITIIDSTLQADTTGLFDGGSIDLLGSSFLIRGSTLTASSSAPRGAQLSGPARGGLSPRANAGEINIASDLTIIKLRPGAQVPREAFGPIVVESSTIATNAGATNGGNIAIIGFDNELLLRNASITASAGDVGVSGDILIANVSQATLQNTQIQALAEAGPGGIISVVLSDQASGALTIENSNIATNATLANGGSILLDGTDNQLVLRNSSVVASAGGNGIGGDITIGADSGVLLQGSQIQALANAGSGGTISVDIGRAGSGELRIEDTRIAANAAAANGGDIALDAGGRPLTLERASIVASAGGNGIGGDIDLANVGGVTLRDSQIQALANAGAGGTITLFTASGVAAPLLFQNSAITTNAVSAGGGNISLDLGGNALVMRDSTILASAGATGTGGSILIDDAGRTILQRSQILARADAGNGGTITVNLDNGALFIRDAQSSISADSNSGNDGAIDINSPDTDLNPAVKPQEVRIGGAPELSANACQRAGTDTRSTFVREYRGGLGASPDGYLVSVRGPAKARQAASLPATPDSTLAVARVDASDATMECR